MKKLFSKYPALCRLAGVLFLAAILYSIGLVSTAVALVFTFQLFELASAPRVAKCFVGGLTSKQVEEFEELMGEIGGNWEEIKKLPEQLRAEQKRNDELAGNLKKLRRTSLLGNSTMGVRWIGSVAYVSDDCAKAFVGLFMVGCHQKGTWPKVLGDQDAGLEMARGWLGVETRAALDATSIPLPTIYVPQIVELIFAYGQFRQYSTVFPLGAGTVNLPQLKPGEDTFGFIGAGTAGMSQAIPEKKVSAQNVTFTANKCGGIVRIPTEIEEDTFIPLGQFLARYIARNFALLEDKTGFLGDGTGTYANIKGVGPYCVANDAYLRTLAAGKTKVTDATVNDFRALRGLVNAAVLANMAANGQTSAAYYMHPSLESLLVTFNVIGSPQIYIPQNAGKPATLDGFPIRWIGVSAANTGLANPSSPIAFFGDLSYWYLGERGAPRVEVSREVYFATDELGMRALERIDIEAMAPDAMVTLMTAAA